MNYIEAADYCVRNLLSSLSVFVGAGFSKTADLPDWNELVRPLAEELEISIHDIPLPRILQYACGHNKSKYSLVLHELKKRISAAQPQPGHYLLTNMGINRIWTTNYDDLIEKAYFQENKPLEVITNDFQMQNSDFSCNQLIKMHGSLSSISDNYDDIILLESQYENFELTRRNICNLLQNDISCKSFLFLGVSFDDINMRKNMGVDMEPEARRQAELSFYRSAPTNPVKRKKCTTSGKATFPVMESKSLNWKITRK